MFASSSSQKRRGFRPGVETLEDRCVPAAGPGLKILGEVLKDNGTNFVLVGMLKPANPSEAQPAFKLVNSDSSNEKILVGMLQPLVQQVSAQGLVKQDPSFKTLQVTPPADAAIAAYFGGDTLPNFPDKNA